MACIDCKAAIPRRGSGARRDIRCEDCKEASYTARRTRDWRNKKFRQYGIDVEQYEAMLAAQGGGCAFCGSTSSHPTRDQDFHIDHDHSCCPGTRSCGRCVRFLLCSFCNPGLGYFRDDPALLRRAADLLEARQSGGPQLPPGAPGRVTEHKEAA